MADINIKLSSAVRTSHYDWGNLETILTRQLIECSARFWRHKMNAKEQGHSEGGRLFGSKMIFIFKILSHSIFTNIICTKQVKYYVQIISILVKLAGYNISSPVKPRHDRHCCSPCPDLSELPSPCPEPSELFSPCSFYCNTETKITSLVTTSK